MANICQLLLLAQSSRRPRDVGQSLSVRLLLSLQLWGNIDIGCLVRLSIYIVTIIHCRFWLILSQKVPSSCDGHSLFSNFRLYFSIIQAKRTLLLIVCRDCRSRCRYEHRHVDRMTLYDCVAITIFFSYHPVWCYMRRVPPRDQTTRQRRV